MSGSNAGRPVKVQRDEEGHPRGEPKSTPCRTCPWRTANVGHVTGLGADHDVFYTLSAHSKMWSGNPGESPPCGLRDGEVNTCHQVHTRPCAGTLALQQRELIRLAERQTDELPGGRLSLTIDGIKRIATRMMMGGARRDDVEIPVWRLLNWLSRTPKRDMLELAHPAISDPAIGHHELEPPRPGEFE